MFDSIKNNIVNYKNNIKKESYHEMIKTINDYYNIFNKKLEDYLTDGDIEGFINLFKDEIKKSNRINVSFAEIIQSKLRLKDKLKNQAESFNLGESSIKNIISNGIGSYKVDNLVSNSSILSDGLINGISPKTLYSLVPALLIDEIDINNITISTLSNVIIFKSVDDNVVINKTHEELEEIGVISMRDAMELKRLDNNNYNSNIKEIYEDSKIDYRDIEDIELEEDEEFENYNNIIDNLKNVSKSDYEEDDYEVTTEEDDYY